MFYETRVMLHLPKILSKITLANDAAYAMRRRKSLLDGRK